MPICISATSIASSSPVEAPSFPQSAGFSRAVSARSEFAAGTNLHQWRTDWHCERKRVSPTTERLATSGRQETKSLHLTASTLPGQTFTLLSEGKEDVLQSTKKSSFLSAPNP